MKENSWNILLHTTLWLLLAISLICLANGQKGVKIAIRASNSLDDVRAIISEQQSQKGPIVVLVEQGTSFWIIEEMTIMRQVVIGEIGT